MRWTMAGLVAVGVLAGAATYMAPTSGADEGAAVPIFGIKLPADYRDWRLISVAREEGKLNDLRAVLGNDIAIAAARRGDAVYPDGAIIARLAWDYTPLPESAAAFGQAQSHVALHPKNGVQFMVKDSKKYAATGGWGYAHFNDGQPGDAKVHGTCFACHQTVASRDYVFNRYAP
ncbi:MAG: cytochrome P460 family protein [Proteobacteria bacterium]|nr:cytochrome P460 family protein [Pseudomonadota bacterium]